MTERRSDEAELAVDLAVLAPVLDAARSPAPSPALVARTLRLALDELAKPPALLPGVAAARAQLPVGFRRELARMLAAALPALVLALAWAGLVLRHGPAWLGSWLPADVALALIGAPLLIGLSALGLTTASLPLLAHRRALLRMRGAI
jgi:hypothetical protein